VFAQFGRYGQETGGTFKAKLLHTGAWSAFIRIPRSEAASAWMLAAASSSSLRTAGLLTAGSPFTTSTLGTRSGRNSAISRTRRRASIEHFSSAQTHMAEV